MTTTHIAQTLSGADVLEVYGYDIGTANRPCVDVLVRMGDGRTDRRFIRTAAINVAEGA